MHAAVEVIRPRGHLVGADDGCGLDEPDQLAVEDRLAVLALLDRVHVVLDVVEVQVGDLAALLVDHRRRRVAGRGRARP